jgi:hypothetical protein
MLCGQGERVAARDLVQDDRVRNRAVHLDGDSPAPLPGRDRPAPEGEWKVPRPEEWNPQLRSPACGDHEPSTLCAFPVIGPAGEQKEPRLLGAELDETGVSMNGSDCESRRQVGRRLPLPGVLSRRAGEADCRSQRQDDERRRRSSLHGGYSAAGRARFGGGKVPNRTLACPTRTAVPGLQDASCHLGARWECG